MNWEMVGAIGQLAAAIGVVPSLIYLAMQVRDQNKERGRASLDLLSLQWADLIRSIIESPDFGLIYLRGLQSFEELDPLSKIRFGAYLLRFCKQFEGMYFHYLDGTLRPSTWAALERSMADVFAYPGAQAWWLSRKHWYTEETCRIVDRLITEVGKPQAYSDFAGPAGGD